MSKTNTTIAGIYVGTIILPYILTNTELLNFIVALDPWHNPKHWLWTLYGGFFHWPSLVFIIISALTLHHSIKVQTDKTKKNHSEFKRQIDDSIEQLEVFEEDSNKFLQSSNVFSKDIRKIILKGGMEEDIELILDKHLMQFKKNYEKLINEYGYISTVLPMLGMIGTISGLLQMFAVPEGIDNFAEKLAGLSVALATTLYATLWVVFVTKPKAREIENWYIDIENDEQILLINAKLFLHTADISILENIEEIKEEE